MSPSLQPLVVIPARMASRRLPGKPLADVAGEPLIVRVWRVAVAAALGPVVVACAEPEIADAITAAGGEAVLTRADHASGSDRVHEAVERLDPEGRHDVIVNLQGDMLARDSSFLRRILAPIEAGADIATLVKLITDPAEAADPSVVKAVMSFAPGADVGRALYFSRAAVPAGEGPLYHHIGVYAFRRAALSRFVSLPRGSLEEREKLEQLRALEAGMRIDAALVDTEALDINTPAGLDQARALVSQG